MPKIHGSCLCGAVRVAVRTSSHHIGVCHCSMCRKWGGGPLFAFDNATEVHFDGESNIGVFSSSDWAERGFCSRCGTHLFYRLKNGNHYSLPVGLLDDAPWEFTDQIFVDEKPAFYDFANQTKNLTGAEVFAQFSPPSA